MPIFEYQCQCCNQDFEQLVLNARTEIKCPQCQSTQVNKKMSACAIKSGSKFVASSGGGGCGSCSSHHCSTCH